MTFDDISKKFKHQLFWLTVFEKCLIPLTFSFIFKDCVMCALEIFLLEKDSEKFPN